MEDDFEKMKKWKTTSKKREDDLKKNGRRPKKKKKREEDLKKIKWKTNKSTKINLIGCDTIVNSPSLYYYLLLLSRI